MLLICFLKPFYPFSSRLSFGFVNVFFHMFSQCVSTSIVYAWHVIRIFGLNFKVIFTYFYFLAVVIFFLFVPPLKWLSFRFKEISLLKEDLMRSVLRYLMKCLRYKVFDLFRFLQRGFCLKLYVVFLKLFVESYTFSTSGNISSTFWGLLGHFSNSMYSIHS